MQVKIFPANQATALKKIADENKVRTVAQAGDQVFVEYVSSEGDIELIAFKKEDDNLFVWHECFAQKSKYAYGCWHMGLIAWIYDLPEQVYKLELLPPVNHLVAEADLTPTYLNRAGEFNKITLNPKQFKELQLTETMSEKEFNSLPEEDKFLSKFRLPKPIIERLLVFRNQQKVRLTDDQKSRVHHNVDYIPQGDEVVAATTALLYDIWAPPLLSGPRGTGKSSLAELMSEIMYLPLRKISGGSDINLEYLLGTKTLKPVDQPDEILLAKIVIGCQSTGSSLTPEEVALIRKKLTTVNMEVVFKPGILLQAIMKGEMVLLDEMNALLPEVSTVLHPLLDWQRTISVPELDEVKAHPDFRFISAMNPGYLGTRPLNKSFQDRFRTIPILSVKEDIITELLTQWVDNDTAKKLTKVYMDLYKAVNSPQGATLTEDCLSLRSLQRAAEEYSLGLGSLRKVAVSCLTGSIESEQEREQVKDLIEMNLS